MEDLSNKRKEELEIAKIFLEFFNGKNSTDYFSELNNNENMSDEFVDVYAKSSSGSHDTMLLQVKGVDWGFKKNQCERKKEAEMSEDGSSDVWIRDLEPVQWVNNSIVAYKNKYAPAVQSKIILILWIYHATKIDDLCWVSNLPNTAQIDYRAVYFVNKVAGISGQVQVMPIKPFFK